MKPYKVTLNNRKFIINAESWFQVFQLAMSGQTKTPKGFSIVPVKLKLV